MIATLILLPIMTGCAKHYGVIDATETVTISKGEYDNLVTDRKLLRAALEECKAENAGQGRASAAPSSSIVGQIWKAFFSKDSAK